MKFTLRADELMQNNGGIMLKRYAQVTESVNEKLKNTFSYDGTIYGSNDINLVKELGAVALETALEDILSSNELTLSNKAVENIAHRVGEIATKETEE